MQLVLALVSANILAGRTVASAVIVPDAAEQLVSPSLAPKRRQSLSAESDSKRLRFGQEGSY